MSEVTAFIASVPCIKRIRLLKLRTEVHCITIKENNGNNEFVTPYVSTDVNDTISTFQSLYNTDIMSADYETHEADMNYDKYSITYFDVSHQNTIHIVTH